MKGKSEYGLRPLREMPFRHRRLFYGISMQQLSIESGISTRKLSLYERGLIELQPDQATLAQRALETLSSKIGDQWAKVKP